VDVISAHFAQSLLLDALPSFGVGAVNDGGRGLLDGSQAGIDSLNEEDLPCCLPTFAYLYILYLYRVALVCSDKKPFAIFFERESLLVVQPDHFPHLLLGHALKSGQRQYLLKRGKQYVCKQYFPQVVYVFDGHVSFLVRRQGLFQHAMSEEGGEGAGEANVVPPTRSRSRRRHTALGLEGDICLKEACYPLRK